MSYFNHNDPEVTGDHYVVHDIAYKVGAISARVYSLRNQVAHNPFKPLTRLWYSFNLGAREFLEAMPDIVGGKPVYRTFTYSRKR